MKEKKSKRVIVRITENQFKNLMDCVITENQNRYTTSDLIRESVIEKLNKIKEDAETGKNKLDYEYFNRYLKNCGYNDISEMDLIR